MTTRPTLGALSPLDGRYHQKTDKLAEIFSEAGLIKYRTIMEVQYLLELTVYSEHTRGLFPEMGKSDIEGLNVFMRDVASLMPYAENVKEIEGITNHDVKAVEYAIREHLKSYDYPTHFVSHCHFGLTSEDVNNIAYAHMLHDAIHGVILESLEDLNNTLLGLARDFAKTPLLARTHGQPATPTTFGKEMMIFVQRLERQIRMLRNYKIRVKVGGASGNLNGHKVAYPEVNWPQFVQEFIDRAYCNSSGTYFEVNHWNNQIEDHDTYSELFAIFIRINVILKKLAKDMWLYISRELIGQKRKKKEVGSSAMPHKINPIDFENAVGNIKVAIALFEMFCRELPDSILQRDLSDSTVERNFGTAFGHSLIAYLSIEKGLSKMIIREDVMREELDAHPEVLAEPLQLVLKKYGIEDAYEKLKDMTRGKAVTLQTLHDMLDASDLPDSEIVMLKELRPSTYLGYAEKLAIGFDVVDLNYSLRNM